MIWWKKSLWLPIALAIIPGVLCNTIRLIDAISQVYEGGSALFTITAPNVPISATRWTINGVPVDESDIATTVTGVGTRNVDLMITNVSVTYNGSIVTCSAIISGVNFTCDPEATLLVQGILGPAEELPQQYDLINNVVNISWIPPPAMIIPVFGQIIDRPEIFYCVQISGPTTRSIGCNRTGDRNEETSIILQNVTCMVEYDITVIPFNRLGDGRSITIQFPAAPEISDPGTPQFSGNNISYTYEVSGLVCSCRTEDQNIGSNSLCKINTVNPTQLAVTLVDPTLNRFFNPTLFAINSRASSSEEVELSTFDIFNLIISGSASQVNYSLVFIGGSSARGVFIALLLRTNGRTNLDQSLYFVQSVAGAQMSNQISMLPAGSYMALAYDVEETGEITSDSAADQENITVIGPNATENIPFISLGEDINCTSRPTVDKIAVSVTCEYNTTTYNGYRAYIQGEATPTLSFVLSNESGSTVTITTTSNGDYLVFVYPIWRSSSAIPDERIAPAHRQVHNITGHEVTAIPTTDEDTTSDSSQQETFSTASSSESSDTTTTDNRTVVSPGSANMEVVIGVTVAMVVVIIIVVLCIVLLAAFLVRWNKRRKSVFTATEENAFIMSDRDNKRTPSDSEILPVYATTGPPPNKSNNEPVKANGSDAPSSENASTPSGNTALYSTVNLDKKKQEREAKNGSQKDKKGKNTNNIPPPSEAAPVEPAANLYATVGNSQKETQEQTHQESQYETVQLKLPKPAQEKVEDEHLVQYSTIDHLKKAAPEPKKETPKPESVEKPHVDDKIYIRREDCYAVLGGVAARWKEFALLVGASEDYIDEIDCNNSSEYGCLDHFLLMTVKHRSREDISVALVKMGLTDEAQAILQLPSAK